jgi:hypothetical protein
MRTAPKTQDPPHPGNALKDPTNGDETMTAAQASYLGTLCEEAGETFEPGLTKSAAARRIDQLRELTGRRRDH